MIGRRRALRAGLAFAGLGLVGGCVVAPTKVARIGVLLVDAPDSARQKLLDDAFKAGMRELGYVEGRNLRIESRSVNQANERLPDVARELVGLGVDVILTGGEQPVMAAMQVSKTVPIVFANVSNPVEVGLVESYAHPGGTATGLTAVAPELSAKRLEVLRELWPGLARIGVMWVPSVAGSTYQFGEVEAAASALGLRVLSLGIGGADDIEGAFRTAAQERANGLVVVSSGKTNTNAARIVEAAASYRLPAVYPERVYTAAGGLICYGPSFADLWRRAAGYVDRILKGARPADLPVERPTTFDQVLNLAAAKRIGIEVPPAVLARATEVIS